MNIFVIGDNQIRPEDDTLFLEYIGYYIVDHQPEVVVNLGDFWDMPSLSSYDKGRKRIEGRRFVLDTKAGNDALARLSRPILEADGYEPELHMLLGNHDGGRCATAMEADPQLAGALDPKRWFYIERNGWIRHEFLHQLVIEGVTFSHYFSNPNAKGAIGGTAQNKLNKLKMSFVMGHQQGVAYAQEPLKNGKTLHGLVLGSCYLHQEEYRGPQDQNHFRGCAMLHDVRDGEYDLELVSLDRIMRMYS